MKRLASLVALLCSLLLASACGGSSSGDGSPSQPASPPPATSSAPAAAGSSPADATGSAGDAFCTGFDDNGGSPASLGEPPTFYPKDQLVKYAEDTLAVMTGLTPPQPIAAAWAAYEQFQKRLLAAAESLGSGERLGGPVPGLAAARTAYGEINNWISTNC